MPASNITSNLFAPYTFADAQHLLVKPFERLNFVLGFVLVTGLAQLGALRGHKTFEVMRGRPQQDAKG